MSIKEKFKFKFKLRPVTFKNLCLLAFGPIAITIIFGFAFSNIYVEKIPMGILDMDNSSISRDIAKQFKETSKFNVCYYPQSEEELNEAIKTKKVRVGLIIPKNFSKDAIMTKAPKTLLVIDETNLVIGNLSLSYGSEILNTINAGIQLQVLQAHNMVPYAAQTSIASLSFTERMLYEPQLSYMRFLLYGIMALAIQQVYVIVIAPVLIEERLNIVKIKLRSKEGVKKIGKIGVKILCFSILSLVGSTGAYFVAGKYLDLPLRGTILNSYILLAVFLLDLLAVCFVLAFIFDAADQCVRFSMFLSIPTLLTAGFVWPPYMMPPGFYSAVKKIWPLVYFVNPMKIINLKGVEFSAIANYVHGGLYYALFWLPVGIGLYLFKIFGFKYVYRKFLNPKEDVS